jgi:hypothetical protein
VGGLQHIEDAEADAGGPHIVQRAAGQERPEGRARDPLRHGPQDTVVVDDVEDGGDPAGAQHFHGLRLTQDPGDRAARSDLGPQRREPGRGERDGAPELQVLTEPDGPALLLVGDLERPVSSCDQLPCGDLVMVHRHPSLCPGLSRFRDVRRA